MSDTPQERLDLESPPPAEVPEEEQLSDDDFEALPEDDQEALLETPPGSEDRPGLLERIGLKPKGKPPEGPEGQPPAAGEPEVIPPGEPEVKPDKPAEQPIPLSAEQIAAFGGRFKTVQELAKGYRELEKGYSSKETLATRVEALEAGAQAPPIQPPVTVEPPVNEDPMPEYDEIEPEKSMRELIAWQTRETERVNTANLEQVRGIVAAGPAIATTNAFLSTHRMVTPDMLAGIAKVGDAHGLKTLEEAWPVYLTELSAGNGQPGETGPEAQPSPSPPAGGEAKPTPQTDSEKAAAIRAAAGIPPSLSEAPQAAPDKVGDLAKAKVMPLSEFEKLPEAEQERLQELGQRVTND